MVMAMAVTVMMMAVAAGHRGGHAREGVVARIVVVVVPFATVLVVEPGPMGE